MPSSTFTVRVDTAAKKRLEKLAKNTGLARPDTGGGRRWGLGGVRGRQADQQQIGRQKDRPHRVHRLRLLRRDRSKLATRCRFCPQYGAGRVGQTPATIPTECDSDHTPGAPANWNPLQALAINS